MMHVAVCDDDQEQLELIGNLIRNAEHADQLNVSFYVNGGKLLTDIIRKTQKFDVLILDIELNEESGLALANKVLDEAPSSKIIFVSAHQHYFQDVYFITHTAFVAKPIKDVYFYHALERACAEIDADQQETIVVTSNRTKHVLRVRELEYLEQQYKLRVVTWQGEEYFCSETLDSALGRLEQGYLLRIHRSYAVNILLVKEIGAGVVKMRSGAEIPIAKGAKKELLLRVYGNTLQ